MNLKNISEFVKKNREVISYLFFGVLTTVINIVVYGAFSEILGFDTIPSNIVAWIAAVSFAYITNRIWVFESSASSNTEKAKELISFFACRGTTLLIDIASMYVLVNYLGYPNMIMKVIVNVIVVIVNYVLSKRVIFKKKMV